MLSRVTAGLLAMSLVFASGTTASLFFLCSMDGGLHAERCCGDSEEQQPNENPHAERSNCCNPQVVPATAATAAFYESAFEQAPQSSLLAKADVVGQTRPPSSTQVGSLSARGPPSANGLSLIHI